MYILIENFADQMFLGHHFIFHFEFLFCKNLTGPYFTYIYLLQKPRSKCVDAYYNEQSNIFDISIPLEINKQSSLERKK